MGRTVDQGKWLITYSFLFFFFWVWTNFIFFLEHVTYDVSVFFHKQNELGFACLLVFFHHFHYTRGQENIYKRETVNTEPWNTVFILGSFTHWTIFVYECTVSLMSSLFHTLKCYIILTISSRQIDSTCMRLAWNFDSLIVLYTNEVFCLFLANVNSRSDP